MARLLHITIDQGADFSQVIPMLYANGASLDITGYTANSVVKKNYTAANTAVFTTAISGANLTLSLTDVETGAMAAGRYVYDIKLTDGGGIVSRQAEGIVTVRASVTP